MSVHLVVMMGWLLADASDPATEAEATKDFTSLGWALFMFSSFVPLGLPLMFASPGPLVLGMGLAQAAGILLGVRASFRWLRNRLPVWLVGIALLPFYMGLCLLTNLILIRLGNLISTG